jgi:ABC-type Mn2+/Zn2+ transport system permease subunit
MSTVPEGTSDRTETVAGFLCAFSFTLSGIALARTPGLLAPVAIILALVAARMTDRHRTLAGVAVIVSALAFFFGMLVSISTDSPLY